MSEQQQQKPDAEQELRQRLAEIEKRLGLDKKKPTQEEVLRARKRS